MATAARIRTVDRSSRRRTWAFTAMLVVPLALQVVWIWWPSLQSAYWSFTDFDGVNPARWIGLHNFEVIATDPVARTAVLNTVKWIVVYAAVPTVLGLALAVAIERCTRGQNVFKTVIYLPGVMPLVATALMWGWLYQPKGLINVTLELIGLGDLGQAWLANPSLVSWAIMVTAIWQGTGFTMVIYLAGLKAVPGTLEDAARVDGATEWKVFRNVTFPALRPMHVIVLSVGIIAALKTFDVVWVMTRGGPFHASATLATYMYEKAFQDYDFGLGSAAAVVIFVVSAGFIALYMRQVLRRL